MHAAHMYVYTTASGKSRRLLAQSTTAPSSASQMGYVLHILLDSSTANALLTCSARARNSLCILLAAKTVRFVTSHLRHQKKKKMEGKGREKCQILFTSKGTKHCLSLNNRRNSYARCYFFVKTKIHTAFVSL